MAKITKRLCMAVGKWVDGEGKERAEYRDIGLMIEFEDGRGNTWNEIKLHADILQPSLAVLARAQMDRGASNVRVKLFDVARKAKDKSAPAGAGAAPPDDVDAPPGGGMADDDIPF